MKFIKLPLLIVLFLNISFKSHSFDITGLDLGDNLLDKLSLNYIKNNTAKNYYLNLKDPYKFTTVVVKDHPEINSKFEVVDVSFKIENQKFIIFDISAGQFYRDNVKNCYSDLFLYLEYAKENFPNFTFKTYHRFHTADPYGKSTISGASSIQNDIVVSVECYDWSIQMTELNGWIDNLSLNYSAWEFHKWLSEKK